MLEPGGAIPLIVRAPVYDTSGYAAHSRDLITTLDSLGGFEIKLEPTLWANNARLISPDAEPYARLIKTTTRPEEAIFLQIGLPHEFERYGKYSIGLTTFEASKISAQWVQACNKMDEVWVTSTLCAEAFRLSGVTVPLEVMPEGVDLKRFDPHIEPLNMTLDLPCAFNFLVFGQWLPPHEHGRDRKNIGRTIEVFLDTFRGREDVGLILVTFMATPSTGEQSQLAARVKQIREMVNVGPNPKVTLVHGVLSDTDVVALYHDSRIKGLLSLAKGEGWWRPGAEAAAAGLPILCTGWGGHTDYLDPAYTTQFKYNIVPVDIYTPGIYHPQEMFWAEPDFVDVKNKMLAFVEQYDSFLELAKHQKAKMSAWSLDKCVGKIADRLKFLHAQGDGLSHLNKVVPGAVAVPTVLTATEI